MKKSNYSVEQVAFALRQAESDAPVPEICRKMGISEQTFYRWRKKYPCATKLFHLILPKSIRI